MDELVKLALLGTAKVSASSGEDYPTDALVAKVDGPPEHQFLLRAGTAAVYHLAGQTADSETAMLSEAAAPETAPVCSPRLAALIDRMLSGESKDVLPEALTRLAQTGHILPPEFLPGALDVQDQAMRDLLRPVMGNRGRWLGQFNPAWTWVKEANLNPDDPIPDDAEQIWQEGTLQVRCRLLQRLRATDPTQASTWLGEVWKQEKAANRVKLLQTFAVGLSLTDEAFLESCLDDRSQEVRVLAASLLAQLPASQWSQRMFERAAEMLSLDRSTRRLRLTAEPPTQLDHAWKRDGIRDRARDQKGKRAEYVQQLLAVVPPDRWEQQFGAEPGELIAASEGDTYADAMIDGWCEAAATFNATQWMVALWDAASKPSGIFKKKSIPPPPEPILNLLGKLPAAEAFKRAEELIQRFDIRQYNDHDLLAQLVQDLPRPWDAVFTRNVLTQWRKIVPRPTSSWGYLWSHWLLPAAHAIPASCFDIALEPWFPPKADRHVHSSYRNTIDKFQEIVRIRSIIAEET